MLELRRRIQADPASIAFAQLAEECRRIGSNQEAVDICRAGLARNPGYLSARVTLGRALIELGQLDAAKAELEIVVAGVPDNLAAIRGLAEILQRRGQMTEALQYYKRALDLAKHDRDLEDTVDRISQVVAPVPPSQPAGPQVSIEEIFNFDTLIDQLGLGPLTPSASAAASAAEGGFGATPPKLDEQSLTSEGGPKLDEQSLTSEGGPELAPETVASEGGEVAVPQVAVPDVAEPVVEDFFGEPASASSPSVVEESLTSEGGEAAVPEVAVPELAVSEVAEPVVEDFFGEPSSASSPSLVEDDFSWPEPPPAAPMTIDDALTMAASTAVVDDWFAEIPSASAVKESVPVSEDALEVVADNVLETSFASVEESVPVIEDAFEPVADNVFETSSASAPEDAFGETSNTSAPEEPPSREGGLESLDLELEAADPLAVMERELRELEERRVRDEKTARVGLANRRRAAMIGGLETWLSAIVADREHHSA